jgi:hypothetical protein
VHRRLADDACPRVPDPVVRQVQRAESSIDGQSGCQELYCGVVKKIVGQVERDETQLSAVLTLKRLGDAGDTISRDFIVAGFGVKGLGSPVALTECIVAIIKRAIHTVQRQT